MTRSDPYASFLFGVEVAGTEIGGFSQVSGLERETSYEEFREGGTNDYLHRLVNNTKYPILTLKRGLTDKAALWAWHQSVIAGEIERLPLSVVVRDSLGEEKWRFLFIDAYPVKWSGSELNSTNNSVFVESVEFVHNGMTRVT